jgi:hypothetical protein
LMPPPPGINMPRSILSADSLGLPKSRPGSPRHHVD